MTKTSTSVVCSAALALTLGACDAEDDWADGGAEGPISFRDGDGTWGVGKLNTNFLGEDETLPLNAISLSGLPLATEQGGSVRLHAVWMNHCASGAPGTPTPRDGLFYASEIDDGELGIAVVSGKLQSATFKLLADPSVTCTIGSSDWVGTVWGVILTDKEGVESNHYLRIDDHRSDENGNPVYHWSVFTGLGGDDPFSIKYYRPTCIEDQDPFGDAYVLRWHAYLIPDLAVDPDSGDFSVAPNTMYLACTSGAVAKSIYWKYSPWKWGSDLHELATRVVRADYCGTGVSFTKQGNALQVRDKYGLNKFAAPEFKNEAAWDLETSRATCLTLPREHAHRKPADWPKCAGKTLPTCSASAMTYSIISTKVAD